MAKIVENKKKFIVFETSLDECLSWGGIGVCDHCNKKASTGYLVAVLNHWVCKECYDNWLINAINYPEDRPYEKKTAERYKLLLDEVQ